MMNIQLKTPNRSRVRQRKGRRAKAHARRGMNITRRYESDSSTEESEMSECV